MRLAPAFAFAAALILGVVPSYAEKRVALVIGNGAYATAPRLPNTVCFAVPGVEAATLMIALDLAGIAVSSGSACSSGKVAPSHVLAAMGVRPELARGAIRLSLGWASTETEVERFATAFAGVMARMRAARRGALARNAQAAAARE